MNKKSLSICIMGIIISSSLLRRKITFESLNYITILYLSILIIVGIILAKQFNPVNKNFWRWLGFYFLSVIGIIIYFFIK